jgi:hypothetical protein
VYHHDDLLVVDPLTLEEAA